MVRKMFGGEHVLYQLFKDIVIKSFTQDCVMFVKSN